MNPPRTSVTVVVPTYNERENLPELVRRVFAVLDPRQAELLVVDDDSPDGTATAAEALRSAASPVRVVRRVGERGLATAVIRGIREARGDIIVVMDADLSHPPEAIPALLEALEGPDARRGLVARAARRDRGEVGAKDADRLEADTTGASDRLANTTGCSHTSTAVHCVVGSRFVPGGRVDLHWPLHRRLNSLVGRLLARPLTPVRDMMAGFFCFRRRDVDVERLRPVGYKILLEMIVRQGVRTYCLSRASRPAATTWRLGAVSRWFRRFFASEVMPLDGRAGVPNHPRVPRYVGVADPDAMPGEPPGVHKVGPAFNRVRVRPDLQVGENHAVGQLLRFRHRRLASSFRNTSFFSDVRGA
ncbi:MAG TPA: glycosyltransferase [Vicinamibacterales bacterium]|nr:glycosyltransferase [Vicinamibacterales bacterium]